VLRAALFLMALLGGCTTIASGGETRSAIHLGVTAIRIPQTRGDVHAASVRTLGVGWDAGPFLGWHSANWIAADPARCQLLVVIRQAVEADNAIRIINALEGQNPCIVDYTNTLRP
jgi:hypothetical protein